MARNNHRDLLGNSVANHVPDPGPSEIVKQQALVLPLPATRFAFCISHDATAFPANEFAHPCRNTRFPPSNSEIPDRPPVVPREDEVVRVLGAAVGSFQLRKP